MTPRGKHDSTPERDRATVATLALVAAAVGFEDLGFATVSAWLISFAVDVARGQPDAEG